jgi:hypothetical protein
LLDLLMLPTNLLVRTEWLKTQSELG